MFVSLVISLVVLLHVYKRSTIFCPPSDHDPRARLQGNLKNVVNPVQKLIPIGANTDCIWNGFAETSVVVLSTCLCAAGNWATKIKQHYILQSLIISDKKPGFQLTWNSSMSAAINVYTFGRRPTNTYRPSVNKQRCWLESGGSFRSRKNVTFNPKQVTRIKIVINWQHIVLIKP